MRQSIILTVIIAILLLSTLAASVGFNNYWYISSSTYLELAFGVCFGVILIFMPIILNKKILIQCELHIPDLLVLIWAAYYLFSYIISKKYNFILSDALIMGIAFSTYCFIRIVNFKGRKYVKDLFYVILLFGVLESIYGILQILDILPNIFQFKFGGSFGNPGDLANFLTVTYIVTLGLYFHSKENKYNYLLLAVALLQVSVIIISEARTAWIASFLFTTILIWYYRFSYENDFILRRIRKHVIPWSLFFTVLLGSGISGAVLLYNFKPNSANGRLFMYQLSTELIFENPLFGHGYNSFEPVQHQMQINYFENNKSDYKNGWLASEVTFAFNDYLQLAIEFGLLLLLLVIVLIWRLFSFKKVSDEVKANNSDLLFIGRSALGSILVCMVFSYPLQNPTILLIFFILLASISTFDDRSLFILKLKRLHVIIAGFIGLAFAVFVLFYGANSIKFGLKWKQAYALLEKSPKECLQEYEGINRFLKHDLSFMYNYGSIFFHTREFEKCIKHYEKNKYLYLTTETLVMIGQSYEELKDFSKAEENYKAASFLVPHKFLPKYKLFKLYEKTGNNNNALEIALEIRNMKVKVFSDVVKNIKTEINKYLASRNEDLTPD